jgi:phosphopantetheinyl transferase
MRCGNSSTLSVKKTSGKYYLGHACNYFALRLTMSPNLRIQNLDLSFNASAPQLPINGQLMFWLLPALKSPRISIAQLLALELGETVEWQIAEFGKPVIKGEPLAISWSHTRWLTLVALRKVGALGVDLEGPRSLSNLLMQRCYTLAEQAQCVQVKDAALRIWCLKEAYVKALGRGIAFGLQRIDCSGTQLNLLNLGDECSPRSIAPAYIASFKVAENHHAALACLDEAPESFVAIDLRKHCLE